MKRTLYFLSFLAVVSIPQISIAQTLDTLTAHSYCKTADSLLVDARFKKSIETYDKAQFAYQEAQAWKRVAHCLNQKSNIQKIQSNFKASLENANKALEICNQYLPKNSREEAFAYDNIGHYYEQSVSDFPKARENFDKALAIRRKLFPEEHKDIALSYDKIGVWYHRQGHIETALEYYKKCLAIRENVFGQHHPSTGETYTRIGMVQKSKGNYQEAIEWYTKNLNITLNTYGEGHPLTASPHSDVGGVYMRISRYKKAEFFLKKSLEIRINSQIESRENEAHLHYQLGTLYKDIDRGDLSELHYNKAITLYKELFGIQSIHVANAYYSLGLLYGGFGLNDKRLEYLYKALEIYTEKYRNSRNLGKIYNGIGNAYRKKGAYEKAQEFYKKSLDFSIKKAGENHYQTATALNSLAYVSIDVEDYDQALLYAKRALEINKKVFGETHEKIGITNNVTGNIYFFKQQYNKALTFYEEGLNVFIKVFDEDNSLIAESLENIAKVKRAINAYDEALEYYNRAKKIRENIFDSDNNFSIRSDIFIAEVYYDQGFYNKALDYYTKVVRSSTENQINRKYAEYLDNSMLLTGLIGQAKCNTGLYQKNKDEPYLNNAIAHYKKADLVINKIRQGYTSFKDKVAFSKQTREVYQKAIEAQFLLYSITSDQKLLEKAFYYVEKSRANILREMVNDPSTNQSLSLPGDLVSLEKRLRINKAFHQSKIANFLQNDSAREDQELASKSGDSLDISYHENKLFEINRRQDSLTQVLLTQYPKYYQLLYANDLITLNDIQKRLDENSALLEFFVSDSTTYTFSISKDTIVAKSLSTAELEEKVKSFRDKIVEKDLEAYQEYGHDLYTMLIAPLQPHLNSKHLTIIPDGPLWHLNFDLLLTTKLTNVDPTVLHPREYPYLMKKHAISYANSADLRYNRLKDESSDESIKKQCLAFSYSNSTKTSDSQISFTRLRSNTEDLPGTRKEIRFISNIVDGEYYYGATATESNFKRKAGEYAIVHLALHGEVDNEHPENSKLFFTKTQDTLEDSFLYNHELFAMNIPSRLTVLSACNTGSGKIANGEGIMSLGSAFQYAGTKSLLLTNWAVSDETTPAIMQYFYKNLKEGMPKNVALQQAKLKYLNSEEFYYLSDPFYWGGFYLVGDPDPIQFANNNWWYWILGIGFSILLLGLFYFINKKKR